jgi:hypothetical protein
LKIVITAKSVDSAVVAAVHMVTGLPIAEANRILAAGGVLLEGEPITDEDLRGQMRALLDVFSLHHIEPLIFLLASDAKPGDATYRDRIFPEAVKLILRRGELVGVARKSREAFELSKDQSE